MDLLLPFRFSTRAGGATEVNVYGYDGYHLVLTVPENGFGSCDDGYFDGYGGPTIGRYYQGPG